MHGATIEADGDFGAGTDTALRTFQAAQGLESDGVAGAATRAALLADPTTAAGGAGSTEDVTPSGAGDMAAVLDIVNAQRAAASCPALRADGQLERAAVLHAQDMVDQGTSATPASTGGPSATASRPRVREPRRREHRGRQQTAQAVMDAWMGSEGHRANILNCDFTTMGLGRVGNTWVQVFGY
ncbi:CAP domain-containing protein [Oerskovia sp. M15]